MILTIHHTVPEERIQVHITAVGTRMNSQALSGAYCVPVRVLALVVYVITLRSTLISGMSGLAGLLSAVHS
jgi:predicted ABC-type sugar transport system permease subunit